MDDQLQVLQTVAIRLERTGISFMLTGSVAMDFYAVPRMTRDIDLVIEIDPSKADGLMEAFRDDFYFEPEAIKEAIGRKGMFNLIHRQAIVKVDFIVRKDDEYRKVEFGRRRRVDLSDGIPVWIVSPEDLLLSKLIWMRDSGSDLQSGDAANIIRAVPELDAPYLEKWARILGLTDPLAKAAK